MSDFGFVGPAYEAASRTQDDQVLINWYPEVDQTKQPGQRGVIALYPTPGLVTKVSLGWGEIRGMHVVPGGQTLYVVRGSKLYSVDTSYTATEIASLYSASGIVYMDDNGSSLYITDGDNRYSYTWGTSTFAVQTDGPFTAGGVCGEIDNYLIYNNPGTNQWACTDVSSVSSNALNLGEKIGYSDNIVSLIADHRQVLLLGETTSERWADTGATPFPFTPIPGTSIQHGLQARNSVARLGEGVAYLALDDRGQATVVIWGAALPSPQRISTFAIEQKIQSYDGGTSDAVAYSYAQNGHEFYVITFPSADVTWCYDLSTGYWHQRAWRDSNTGRRHRHRSNCAAVFNNENIVGDFENGKIYALSLTTFTDAGDPIPCIRRCPHITSDLKRQFFSDLQVQFQPGVGIQSGQGSDPECLLRWSNDGGFTFGNDHIIKLGKVGQYTRRAMKRRLGWGRDRVFEIEMTDPVYRVVVSANLNASAGAN